MRWAIVSAAVLLSCQGSFGQSEKQSQGLDVAADIKLLGLYCDNVRLNPDELSQYLGQYELAQEDVARGGRFATEVDKRARDSSNMQIVLGATVDDTCNELVERHGPDGTGLIGVTGPVLPRAEACLVGGIERLKGEADKYKWHFTNLCTRALTVVVDDGSVPLVFDVPSIDVTKLDVATPSISDYLAERNVVWVYKDAFDAACSSKTDKAECLLEVQRGTEPRARQ